MRLYMLGACGVLFIFLWQLGIFQALFSTLVYFCASVLGILTGIVLYLDSGKQKVPKTPKLPSKFYAVSRFLEKKTLNAVQRPYKHRTVISRSVDKSIQEILDFFIRDFCLSWFRILGKDEVAFVDLMTEELWDVIMNTVERLKNVDTVRFLSSDVVEILTTHFQNLRLADNRSTTETPVPFVLHPCLSSKKAEVDYIRKITDVLLHCFLPEQNSNCPGMRCLLREVLTFSVIKPLAEMICDPDYINQTLLIHLEAKEALAAKHKPRYAYAETYEDFIRMINTCNSVETLKQMRYHIIAEIMQATTINNLKGIEKLNKEETNQPLKKDSQLRSRNLKRYINQCTVAKAQCEKRIKLLGGPDYTSHNTTEPQKSQTTASDKTKAVPKPANKATKVLSFIEIMDNSLARSFFMSYLQNHTHSKNMLSFWMAIENLKLVKATEIIKSTQEIYQVYVVPSSEKSIMLDTTLVRDIEGFLNGTTKDLQCFFDAQMKVYKHLENNFYRRFVLSQEYFMLVCQLEAEMDDLRAQQKDDTHLELNWNDQLPSTDEEDAENNDWTPKSVRKPSTVEERSDSIVKQLQVLDQRLAAKTHQLELTKRSYGQESDEIEKIEEEISALIAERRHLEFHIERTDVWCENIGKWKVSIENVEWTNEEDKSIPVYIIVVHCSQEDPLVPPASGITERTEGATSEGATSEGATSEGATSEGATSEGWVVTRKFKDFQTLHTKLKECSPNLTKELPAPTKKWYKSMDDEFLNKSRIALEEYLQSLLADDKLCLSEELYSFLSPSPEHLRKQSEPTKKTGFSFMSVLKSLPFDIIPNDEAEEEMEQEDSTLPKDSIAEPFYGLIGEVFELKGVFKWLRRTLITFVQITFGGTINKEIREMVEWLVSESMVIYYVNMFRDSMWPSGTLAKPLPTRTAQEKNDTKIKAKKKLVKDIPEILQSLVGKKNSKLGTIKVFEAFQDQRINKHLFYVMLELCVFTLCPEVKSEKIIEKAKEMKRAREANRPVAPQ